MTERPHPLGLTSHPAWADAERRMSALRVARRRELHPASRRTSRKALRIAAEAIVCIGLVALFWAGLVIR